MRVGLINFNRKGVREPGLPPVPPIGLEYLVDDLDEDYHETSLLDLCFIDLVDRTDAISEFVERQDVVGITFRNYGVDSLWLLDDQFFVPELREVVSIVRRATRAPIVLGGQGFSVDPERVLAYAGADFGVAGPGETAFRSLLKDLRRHAPGSVLRGPGNLDIVHKRRLIDYPAYLSRGGSAAIATKTGCPFSCNYCLEQRRPLQRRNMRSVAEELRILSSRGAGFLFVAEPEFNNHLRHALDFCNLLLEENFFFEWTTYLYPAPITEELVRKLKASGCVNPCVSVGAGNDGVLRALDNRFTVAHVRQMAEWFHKYSLPFTVDLLFGGPGDTLATARETISLMEEIQPVVAGMNLGVRLYRNTALGRRFLAGGLDTAGKLYGSVEDNADLFEPIFYISDMRIRDFLMDVCDGNPAFQLLGYSGFAGVNYKAALQEA
jgi:hypothetical protein